MKQEEVGNICDWYSLCLPTEKTVGQCTLLDVVAGVSNRAKKKTKKQLLFLKAYMRTQRFINEVEAGLLI